ncbi:MAG: class I SAM-dependent methyltransferase [Actinomycetales bacterium]|nr:class I SAM-dependent methyltransferase [Actinomycetales bacterium]
MTDWNQTMRERSVVAEQYATTDRLTQRIGIWGPGPDGIDPVIALRDAVIALEPHRVVEMGCGTGLLAAQVCRALPECDYLATDLSPAMVTATVATGATVRAMVASADTLPVADGWADVVIAAWMLYHVPDLDAVIAEAARVLTPGGTFFAVTNGDEHLATLLADAGSGPVRTQFSAENGAAVLGRRFSQVHRQDIRTEACFTDHAAATAYLATVDPDLAAGLPWFDGPRRDAGFTTIFTATGPLPMPGRGPQ